MRIEALGGELKKVKSYFWQFKLVLQLKLHGVETFQQFLFNQYSDKVTTLCLKN